MVFSVYCLVTLLLVENTLFFYERLVPFSFERLAPFSFERLVPFSYERHALFIKTQRFFFLKKQRVLCYGLMKSDDLTIVQA